MWFTKKVTLFKKKDRDTWQKIRDILKSEGFTGVRASHYSADSLNACGCGSKLDPRNFGAGGRIDRAIYYVEVRQENEQKARNILAEKGIAAVVDDDPVGRLGRAI